VNTQTHFSDARLKTGSVNIQITPSELPASRRVLLTLECEADGTFTGSDDVIVAISQAIIMDKKNK